MSDPDRSWDVPDPDPASFQQIADLVFRYTGIRLGPGKAYFVLGRLGPLYRSLRCRNWGELCRRLQEGPGGYAPEELVQAVVTRETQFFRDDLPFRALTEKILPEAVGGKSRPAPFRVWSAGCSTGQEPYSIVMALWGAVERGEVAPDVWATDICRASLSRAKLGVYEPLELARGLGAPARKKFFGEMPGGAAQVREEVRRRVRFDRLNLSSEEPREGGFHAVFCRNVAIYFDQAGKRRLYECLGRRVVPGGYLILGAAETLFPTVPGFETVYFEKCLLFRKAGEARP